VAVTRHGEALLLVQCCFTGLVLRIFNRAKIQDNSLTPNNVDLLNIFIYGSPFCVTITRVTNFNKWYSFLAHSVRYNW